MLQKRIWKGLWVHGLCAFPSPMPFLVSICVRTVLELAMNLLPVYIFIPSQSNVANKHSLLIEDILPQTAHVLTPSLLSSLIAIEKFPDKKVMRKQCFPSCLQTCSRTMEALGDQYTRLWAWTEIVQVNLLYPRCPIWTKLKFLCNDCLSLWLQHFQ